VCGIAGAFDVERAFFVLHDLLLHLQHRGQESVGIVMDNFTSIKGHGLVKEVLTEKSFIEGHTGIGHVRYSTVGGPEEIQPLVGYTGKGKLAIAHNGTIPDASHRRETFLERGAVFSTTVDSELFLHYVSIAPFEDSLESVLWALQTVPAAYSLLVLNEDFMIGARDPYGYRPLFWGKYDGGYVLASEDSALVVLGASDITEVERGQVIILEKGKSPKIQKLSVDRPGRFCVFEYIYFARPDSNLGGINVHKARFEMGRWLYKEHKIQADIVIPVLDSGLSGALGFSSESGIPMDFGLMRNRYMGRTFIMPTDRESSVRKKLIPIPEVVKDKDVLLIDDSIVRGSTMGVIVSMLREAGARKVIVGIHSPPAKYPCFYGIDTATRRELIASDHTVEEIRETIGADELFYLSIEGLIKAVGREDVCLACLNGHYDTWVPEVDSGV